MMPSRIAKHTILQAHRIETVRTLAFEIVGETKQDRQAQIQRIVDYFGDVADHGPAGDTVDTIAVFFEAALDHLISKKQNPDAPLYRFFSLINHLPVLKSSPIYEETLQILAPLFLNDASSVKTFDRLQLLYLHTEIGFWEAAKRELTKLEEIIGPDQLSFYALFKLCRFRSADAHESQASSLRDFLEYCLEIKDLSGPEATIFLMLYWLSNCLWFKEHDLYRILLMDLYQRIRQVNCLNCAFVGVELFSMDDKQISPPLKIGYCQDLIRDQNKILNSMQLNSLYFYAGNYLSGLKEQFRESINSYKSSNYYLHKCWERLIGISTYLRSHHRPADYKHAMLLLEQKFLDLSNQTSLRTSSYVENLQSNFEKIDQLYREVGELSLTDSLTGQRNRRYMDYNLPQLIALASRQNVPVSFIMIDVDNFKHINDHYGHAVGDTVLTDLAAVLSAEFRQSDVIIRYGGDEFFAVLFNSGREHSTEILEKLRQKIEQKPFCHNDLELKITISIGLYIESFAGKAAVEPMDDYIKRADIALYQAKEAGRNRIMIYHASEFPA